MIRTSAIVLASILPFAGLNPALAHDSHGGKGNSGGIGVGIGSASSGGLGVGVSVGGTRGVNSNTSIGGERPGGQVANSHTSIGGTDGVNARANVGSRGSSGVGANVGASVGGSRGVKGGASAALGGNQGSSGLRASANASLGGSQGLTGGAHLDVGGTRGLLASVGLGNDPLAPGVGAATGGVPGRSSDNLGSSVPPRRLDPATRTVSPLPDGLTLVGIQDALNELSPQEFYAVKRKCKILSASGHVSRNTAAVCAVLASI